MINHRPDKTASRTTTCNCRCLRLLHPVGVTYRTRICVCLPRCVTSCVKRVHFSHVSALPLDTHTHTHTHARTHARTYTHTHARTHARTHTHAHMCTHVRTRAYVLAYTHVHTCTHAHKRRYMIHTRTRTCHSPYSTVRFRVSPVLAVSLPIQNCTFLCVTCSVSQLIQNYVFVCHLF